jgi:virulence-associated protein VagC
MYINPHDQVLADLRFPVGEQLLIKQAELVIAPEKKSAAQMTSTQIKNSKKVANVRINIEQVVYRLKRITFLTKIFPINMLKHANDVRITAIANMQGFMVKTWDF